MADAKSTASTPPAVDNKLNTGPTPDAKPTGSTPPVAPAPLNFNDLVKSADVIDGYDLMDKAELIGVEFVVTGVRFTTGSRNVQYAYMDCVNRANQRFTFNDSSTGIKQQIIDYVSTKTGKAVEYDTGEVIEIMLHVPRGVRVSEYTISDVRGKDRNARTYYLTTGGQ